MSETTVRVGDADREELVATLGRHVGLGHLTIDEFERRADQVYAARTRGELAAVVADLPAPARSAPAPRPPRPHLPTAWVPLATIGAITVAIWLITSLATGHALHFWPIWVVLPWAIALLAGGCRRPGSRHGSR